MSPKPQRSERQDNILSLKVAIDALSLTKEIMSITPAKAVCGSVGVVLTMIRVWCPLSVVTDCGLKLIQDSMADETDYIELGLACADVCTVIGRGMNRKTLDDLSQSVCDAIAQLTTCVIPVMCGLESSLTTLSIERTVAEIQRKVIKTSRRNPVSRLFHAKNDKQAIATWKLDLNRILHIFDVGSIASV